MGVPSTYGLVSGGGRRGDGDMEGRKYECVAVGYPPWNDDRD